MNVQVLDYNNEAGVFGELSVTHDIARCDLRSSIPTPEEMQRADALICTPSAGALVRAGPREKLKNLCDQCVALVRRGGTLINLCEEVPHEKRRGRFTARAFMSSEPIHLFNQPPEGIQSAHSSAFLKAVTRYNARQAKRAMMTPTLRLFLPVGGTKKPPGLRTPLRNGVGVELLFQMANKPLCTRDAANLLQIAAHFHDALLGEGRGALHHRLRLRRSGADCGLILYDEYRCIVENPWDCFGCVVDVQELAVRWRFSGEEPQRAQLTLGEMMAALPLLMYPGATHEFANRTTPFYDRDGKPYEFLSPGARKRQLNSAIQKINGSGVLIERKRVVSGVSAYVGAGVGAIGVIAPDWCFRAAETPS